MRERGGRGRSWRLFDVATALAYYLMFANIAGVHSYKRIGEHPKYYAPAAAELIAKAEAEVEAYKRRIPAGPADAAAITTHLSAAGQALLKRLDTLDAELVKGHAAAAKWDEAIYVAEELRRLGETVVRENTENRKAAHRAAKIRVGHTIALRGAETHARLAHLVKTLGGGGGPGPWKFPQFSPPPAGQNSNISNG